MWIDRSSNKRRVTRTLAAGSNARCFLCRCRDLPEHLVQLAAGIAARKFGERALLCHLLRRFHEAGPGRTREGATNADAAHAEIGGLLEREAGRTDQKIDRPWV